MRWQGRRQSDNVEDRRGLRISKKAGIGGGIGTIVIALIVLLLGGDPSDILFMQQNDSSQASLTNDETYQASPEEDKICCSSFSRYRRCLERNIRSKQSDIS